MTAMTAMTASWCRLWAAERVCPTISSHSTTVESSCAGQQAAICGYSEKASGDQLVVIPTACGKCLVMAAFVEGVLKAWPDQRVLVVTHVRELIAQHHAEMLGLWPEAPAGINSAGLGRRDARARILFAGVKSIHHKGTRIGHADLVLTDEAHLIPGRSHTTYHRFLGDRHLYRRGVLSPRGEARHHLRRYERRARPDHRLQARRDQGAGLDGRADDRLQCAGRGSHRHAAAHQAGRALRP